MATGFNMNTEQTQVEGVNLILKIKSVLYKLIAPEFKLSDDTILQKLYDSIAQIFSVEDTNVALLEVFLPWLNAVLKDWIGINPRACSFSLRILSLICAKEDHFHMLLKTPIVSGFFDLFNNQDLYKASVTSAHLGLINSLLFHRPGCLWIFRKGIWKDVLVISRNNASLYVLRQTHQILADLMIFLGNENILLGQVILDEIFQSCCSISQLENDSVDSIIMKNFPYHHEYFQGSMSHLNSIVILKEIIFKMIINKFSNAQMTLIFGKYKLQEWLTDAINKAANVRVIAELSRLLSIVNIGLLPHFENNSVKYSDSCVLRQQFLDHCHLILRKHQFVLVLEVCIEYIKLWNKYGYEVIDIPDKAQTDKAYVVENTFVIIQTIPLCIYIRVAQITDSDVLEAFIEKIFGLASFEAKRTAYFYKTEFMTNKSELKLETLAVSSVNCFMRFVDICSKELAVLIFQFLVHVIEKLIPQDENLVTSKEVGAYSGPEYSITPNYRLLLTATINALNCYISNFNLTWSDSIETAYLMPLLQKLVIIPDLSPKLFADLLKAQKIVLNGFLPANLALVMNTLEDSSVRFIGMQLLKNLHSPHWEIRDSALEVLQVMASICEQKFPVFQKVILESKLPSVVMAVYENDMEPYVKSSALHCLSYMIRTPSIWDESLINHNLVEKLQLTLLQEPEGIVRYRSILLLREMYNYRRFSIDQCKSVMKLLYHVTVTDLHWEVKNGAILFWDSVLEKKLSDEGMVDGLFPDHLFSREKRKIIKLTPSETSLRVLKVFETLSEYGCLYALWYLVKDDCDLEVTREAGKLITKIMDLVAQFKVPVNKAQPREETYFDCLKRKMSEEEMEVENARSEDAKALSDEVIESIILEGDINLVHGLLKKSENDRTVINLQPRKKLSFDQFHSYVVNFDIVDKQIEKAKWLNKTSDGIASLLDDILVSNQFPENKNIIIDCY